MSHRLTLVILLVMVLSAALVGTTLAADADTKQIGLVIAFPDGAKHIEVVTVPATATTFDALKVAQIDLVSQASSFGVAVCSINKVGCPATNCFCDPKQFWAYYHLNGDTWTAAAEGAGSYVPANGAVEGFAWSGSDASFNPTVQPPVYTFEQIAAAPLPVTLPQTGGNPVIPMLGGLGGLLLVIAGLGAVIWQGRR
jgi:hypothetical protein